MNVATGGQLEPNKKEKMSLEYQDRLLKECLGLIEIENRGNDDQGAPIIVVDAGRTINALKHTMNEIVNVTAQVNFLTLMDGLAQLDVILENTPVGLRLNTIEKAINDLRKQMKEQVEIFKDNALFCEEERIKIFSTNK